MSSLSDGEQQQDELLVLASMFPEFQSGQDGIHSFSVIRAGSSKPQRFTFWFPKHYPSAEPPTVSAPWLAKDRLALISSQLRTLWVEHRSVIMCQFFQWLTEHSDLLALVTVEPECTKEVHSEQCSSYSETTARFQEVLGSNNNEECPKIISGAPLTDRRSKFVAHYARVTSVSEVQLVVNQLRRNKKIANATHNMVAYRIAARDGTPMIENRDDDGETGASDNMLYLLQKMGLEDIVVVCSRWFGGVLLGGDRFRDITGCVKALLDSQNLSRP